MDLSIQLLGVPRVVRDGTALPAPRGHKAWALLAYLVRHPAGLTRTHLATVLFEHAADPLGALRWNLAQLRRLLGGGALRGELIELSPDQVVGIDVDVVARGSWADALCVPGLGHELLEGMSFSSSPSFELWLATERRFLQAATAAILREAALARLAAGDAGDATNLAARLVRLDPLDENFQALLVRCLAAAGDGVGAARQVAICTDLFVRELGTRPGPALAAALHTTTATPTARPSAGRVGVIAQLEAGEAAINAGVLDAGLQCLRHAIVEADAIGDAALRVRARVALGGALVHAARGRDDEGSAALHEALAIGEKASPAATASAHRELAYVEFLRGRYERALAWLRRATPFAMDDRAEQASIATLHGSVLSDTAHYGAAVEMLRSAEALLDGPGDRSRPLAYALSMRGRAQMLSGDLDAAVHALDRSVALAQGRWTAFLPWPLSLRAEVDLERGDVARAAERFEHAFALGCQLGDPCWEGIAARGLGRVASTRGDVPRAVELLLDAITRCVRLPDGYLWGKAYALEALCAVGVAHGLPQAPAWVEELLDLAARTGMRELTARAHRHRASLGDPASQAAARMLAEKIDNPLLRPLSRPG